MIKLKIVPGRRSTLKIELPDFRFRAGIRPGITELVIMGDLGREYIYPLTSSQYEDKPARDAFVSRALMRHAATNTGEWRT